MTCLSVQTKPYINNIANEQRCIIELSGFYCCNEPLPTHIAETAVIKRIENSPIPQSAKIFLIQPSSKEREVTYTVQIAEDPGNDANFKTVLTVTSKYKLVIPGLE